MIAYCEIPMASGDKLLIDTEDYDSVIRYSWCLIRSGRTKIIKYARARVNGSKILLHRFLMNPPPDRDVDHKNHNGLDNRKHNLRMCTDSQNRGNRKSNYNSTSGHKGVTWLANSNKWRVRISNGRGCSRTIGLFTDAHDAACAYNKAALEQWGEFALLNDIHNK